MASSSASLSLTCRHGHGVLAAIGGRAGATLDDATIRCSIMPLSGRSTEARFSATIRTRALIHPAEGAGMLMANRGMAMVT
jgi:hypothetical protein